MRTWQNSHPGGKLSIVSYVLCLIGLWLTITFSVYSDSFFDTIKQKLRIDMPCMATPHAVLVDDFTCVHPYIKLTPMKIIHTLLVIKGFYKP